MFAKVIVDVDNSQVDRTFEYIVPEFMKIKVGHRVLIPFGRNEVEGIVLNVSDTCDFDRDKLKEIVGLRDDMPIITQEQIKLAEEVRDKYRTTFISALHLMFPKVLSGRIYKPKTVRYVVLSSDFEYIVNSLKTKSGKIRSPKQLEIINEIQTNGKVEYTSSISTQIKSLIKKGYVSVLTTTEPRLPFIEKGIKKNIVELSEDQKKAIDLILNSEERYFLLHGVTGSGKTEVYLRVIQETVKNNKTAILLVPEISLTPQIYYYFADNLECGIAVMHSGMSDGQRLDEWQRIVNGEAKLVIGARSAVFAPLQDIGVIIIDEEHESSYKADHYPCFSAHDIARFRCDHFNAKLILASATPTVSTYYQATQGLYKLIEMNHRICSIEMPKVKVVDMRDELKKGNTSLISFELKNAIDQSLSMGKQCMLFLNRRGYSTRVYCKNCGYVFKCDACDTPLIYHKDDNSLRCHYCGRKKSLPDRCPVCGKSYLKYIGDGTQKIVETVNTIFPKANIIRMDLDTMYKKDAYIKYFKDFSEHKADILIGTQMISKGFDFADVYLSAVISADSMLGFGGYRSTERAFTHMLQVAGRAGRKSRGEAIIQTYSPGHYAVKAAAKHDYKEFYNKEIEMRRLMHLPPFSDMITIRFSGQKEDKTINAVKSFLHKLASIYKENSSAFLNVDAKPSDLRRIDNIYRYEITVNLKTENKNDIIERIIEEYKKADYPGVLLGFDQE